MTEDEFDSSTESRPFGTLDTSQAEDQLRRCIALGAALWGGKSDDLQRQLLAPHPEIPSGFELMDFFKLRQNLQIISAAPGDARFDWLPRSVLFSPAILVGTQIFTMWEARCEIVRRAIEYLNER